MCALLSRARPPSHPANASCVTTLVAAGDGDALSHLLARRGVLFVVLFHVAALFGRVHLVPAKVGDLCATMTPSSRQRVDGVMEDTDCDDDSQRRRDACFFKQRSAWQRRVARGLRATRVSRAVETQMSSEFRSPIIEGGRE